jgi:hypothetical protein
MLPRNYFRFGQICCDTCPTSLRAYQRDDLGFSGSMMDTKLSQVGTGDRGLAVTQKLPAS